MINRIQNMLTDQHPDNIRPEDIRKVFWMVAGFALVINALSFSASHLWVTPTSMEYLELSADIAARFDFSNEMFLLRTPAYPLFLAGIFRLCGTYSPTVILILQHLMVVGTVMLITATAWRLSLQLNITLVAGLLTAMSLQTIAFANQVMAETPYTFALVATTYYLVRYYSTGLMRDMMFASLSAGICYLVKPLGMSLIWLCPMVVILRLWMHSERRFKPLFVRACYSLIPALIVLLPWWAENQVTHGANSFTRCLDFALYHRAAYVKDPKDSQSKVMAEIQDVVNEAKESGAIESNANEGLSWYVWKAYKEVRHISLADTTVILGRAAREDLLHSPLALLTGTMKYSVWMALTPDSSYRYHPDGAKGLHGHRPEHAEIFDSGIYIEPYQEQLQRYAAYLPLQSEPTVTTPIWSSIARWFYRYIDHGPSMVIVDSPFEALALFCVLGGFVSLFDRNRWCWLIVAAVIVVQIVPAALLAGVGPRYSMPTRPVMILFGAFMFVQCMRWVLILKSRWLTSTSIKLHTQTQISHT